MTAGTLVMILGYAVTADACQCAPPSPPLDALEEADAVFAGLVVDVDYPPEKWGDSDGARVDNLGRIW